MTPDALPQDWAKMSQADLMAALRSDRAGLGTDDATARRDLWGPNRISGAGRKSVIVEFLKRFRNPLILILLAAAAVSGATGDMASFVIITVVILIGVVLDFVQEHRAGVAAERLKAKVAFQVQVLRDGQWVSRPSEDLVPGDMVRLAAGDLIPADGRLFETGHFFVNQALLTGESYPVEKMADAPADIQGPEAENAAFMGSSVVSGSAHLLVCDTGRRTQLGAIAGGAEAQPVTAFESGIREFGLMIVRITGLLVLFVLLINLSMHRPPLESFLFALALAVGLTPELLPMVVSVTLARGGLRMAEHRVIVKHLPAIHDLGSMDVLCTDKTGTLTEARIRLIRHIDIAGNDSKAVLEMAYLNSFFESGLHSPLDDAILEQQPLDTAPWRKLDEVPFDFERRRVSVLLERDGVRRLILKGAPEDVLALCSYHQGDNETVLPFDDAARARARELFEMLGTQGFRVLAIAWRETIAGRAVLGDEAALTLAGFAAFLDPPKPSAATAIATLKQLGVAVKILSGDNERVTTYVCRELGLGETRILTGAELARMSDDALQAQVNQTDLFCRLNPAQKTRVIAALQQRGHVVGFLGDGINDAPSLRAADVGISVDGAVDIAKDAADLILMDQDLGVLRQGVLEGRRTYANIMKYIMMGTSSNFGNMFSMAGAALFVPFLPLLPIQILLNNLMYDVSEIPIPLDHVDAEALKTPPRWDTRFIRRFMLVLGPVSSLFDFLTFALLLHVFRAGEALFQTGWFIESLATQILVIFVIRTRGAFWREHAHPWLMASSVIMVGLAVLLPFTPLGTWFGFVPPPWHLLMALAGLSIVYLLLAEFVKRRFMAHYGYL